MRNALFATLLSLLLIVSACGKEYKPDETRSGSPTSYELELVKQYIPQGYKIQNSRRVDLADPYIFLSYSDESRNYVGMTVFQLLGNNIKKYYQIDPFFGEEIQFGLSRQEDYWVSGELVDGSYICPVEFNLGGDSMASSFVKIFVVGESFSELEIDLEPWTVILDIFEEQGEQIIRVVDQRLENFSGLMKGATPTRFLFFGGKDGKFIDVTREHINYVRQQVHNSMLSYNSSKGDYQAQYRIGYGIEAYLYAETGGLEDEYIDEIRDMLDPKAFTNGDISIAAEARNLINTSFEEEIPVARLRGFDKEFDDDFRWGKIMINEIEVGK